MLRWSTLMRSCILVEQVTNIVKAKLAGHPAAANIQLIDVRSTGEVAKTGIIPTAINIPLPILADVLAGEEGEGCVTDEEFKDTFGVARPEKGVSQLVFYCAHGVRSAVAVEISEELGYTGALNFSGSWAQWASAYDGEEVRGRVATDEASPPKRGAPACSPPSNCIS